MRSSAVMGLMVCASVAIVTAPPHVMAMQQALKDKGFDPGSVDGVVGPKTSSALRAYQKSENLTTTGRLDGDTKAKLGVPVSIEKR